MSKLTNGAMKILIFIGLDVGELTIALEAKVLISLCLIEGPLLVCRLVAAPVSW